MSADPLLPIAPARVKALVLPVGKVKRQRFVSFLERLTAEHVVQLRDISPDSRPNRNMFSPLAFPDGAIFYELTTHVPHPAHLTLSPFDLYREPLVVIALADGAEMESSAVSKRQSGSGRTIAERNIRALYQDLEELRDQYPRVLVHQLLLFDYVEHTDEHDPIPIPEGILTIPPPDKCKRTTMRTVMCDVSSLLLAEMTALAKSFEAHSYIDSPGQTSTVRQLNGQSWSGDDPSALSRRNSQYSLPHSVRSSSAAGLDRGQARMSMPVPYKGAPFGSSSSTPARPSTPVRSGLSNTPTSNEDSNYNTPDLSSETPYPEQGFPSRPGTAEGFRTMSQDRVSVQGFGSGGLNERWRSKGKGRVTIIMGSLYLQTGRWTDALRELIEGATVAKAINDHIWHGKALELIVISLLLLGWAGIEFQVPTVCLPQTDKASAAAAAVAAQEAEKSADPEQPKWFRSLQLVLPDLLDRILALYSRISAEHLPPLPLAEATIRFCKMLSALHSTEGQLTSGTIELLVTGRPPDKVLNSSPRLTITPSRTLIVTTLFKAFPNSATELLSTVDRVVILTGIASVLGTLGYQRKKAMVIRELVSVLVGGLVEARTRGAAEVGIHPAAGLAALNGVNGQSQTTGAAALELSEGDVEHGIDAFLGLLLRTYGVVGFDIPTMMSPTGKVALDDSDVSAISRIHRQAHARFFGMPSIKLNVLRACINFSEALPDFTGVLRYSSDLLRTAGSGVAPGPRREDAAPTIARDEQVRLVTNILKTSSLSQRLGMGGLVGEFWDEFLLRGVKLEPLPPARTPLEHKKSELAGASTARSSQDLDPLIYNPFLKKADKAAGPVEHTLVAGEPATFKLTLQNPYEIDVEIERVRLDTEGVEFDSAVESVVVGPYRTQILRLNGTPRRSGSLHVTGAVIKVRGCRERRFPVFPQPWSPEREPKVKAIGLAALGHEGAAGASPGVGPAPKTERIALNVIEQQPVVVVKSTTLPQSSVMILEGERQIFSVTLQNLSRTTAADFLLFSFQDSTQEPLQQALGRRDATAQELYEYELILARKQALRLHKRGGGPGDRRYIGPGETATFEFEILGKPGLTGGAIQVDYAHLGVPPEEVAHRFYTRQVTLQLTVTVNASIEVSRVDILPLQGSVPGPLWRRSGMSGVGPGGGGGGGDGDGGEDDEDGSGQQGKAAAPPPRPSSPDEYCLVLLDLRNAWPSYMHVELSTEEGARVEEQILPGNTTRVIVPLRRIYLEDPHASVPALNPARQRQFVVSTSISPEMERASREAFWYRERVLSLLRGEWRTAAGGGGAAGALRQRKGAIELRSIRLSPRMIEAVKVDEVGIEISVVQQQQQEQLERHRESGSGSSNSSSSVILVDEFAELKVRVTNRTSEPIYPTLRLMPALCHRPLNVALDFTRKLAWNGTLQRALPLLPAKGTAEVVLGVTALCRGEFEVTASVEETRLYFAPPPPSSSSKQLGGVEDEGGDGGAGRKRDSTTTTMARPRSDTQSLMDTVLGARERRIWHTRRPCSVLVVDREEEGV